MLKNICSIQGGKLVINRPLLKGRSFLDDPSLRFLMEVLNSRITDKSRLVGGCVRDSLLNREVKDVDIATTLEPNTVIEILNRNNIRYVPTGIEHGTITAIINSKTYEITTLRRDVSTDGRRADVVFTLDWYKDAQRRDFTCNALYCDIDGNVYDVLGTGIEDTLAHRIVFVGNPETRIKEDYLRILRFFRINATIGRGDFDPRGLEACKALKDGIQNISPERIWSEMKRILGCQVPIKTLRYMIETGVLELVFRYENDEHIDFRTYALEELALIEADCDIDPDSFLRLMVLFPRDIKIIKNICAKLRMSNAEKDRLINWAGDTSDINPYMDLKAAKQNIYKMDERLFKDRIITEWANDVSLENYNKWQKNLAVASWFVKPVLPVTGADVLRLGVPTGPHVGKILSEIEAYWLASDFTLEKEELENKISDIVKSFQN